MSDNLLGLTFAGSGGGPLHALEGATRMVGGLVDAALPAWVLAPLAAAACAFALAHRRPSLLQLALLCELPVVAVVLGDAPRRSRSRKRGRGRAGR